MQAVANNIATTTTRPCLVLTQHPLSGARSARFSASLLAAAPSPVAPSGSSYRPLSTVKILLVSILLMST